MNQIKFGIYSGNQVDIRYSYLNLSERSDDMDDIEALENRKNQKIEGLVLFIKRKTNN